MRQKRTWILLAVVLLLTAIFVPTSYAEGTASTVSQTVKTLEITGTGRISYTYDTAEITLGASELADSPTAAFKAMSEKINKVVAAMKAKGITEADLKTGYLNLNQEYDWKDGAQTLRGYRATNTLTIKVKDLNQVPAIMEAAVNAGANQVQGVNFSLANPGALEGQATDAAIDNARAQADRAAKRLGLTVAGVQKVQVFNQSGPTPPIIYRSEMKSAAMADGGAAVYGGNGEYTASVSIVFELK
ncbi:MAG TPA: SIMPL domain-containing protein [Symbiobacteriaceae bacterium]|nr:SIMPL domain-containing protein [Symbiobacteriaceae bacterium]